VQRGRMAAFEFEFKGSFESVPCCLAGKFAPADAIQYSGFGGETIAADGRAWTRKPYQPASWVEAPERLNAAGKIVRTLFPSSDYVGQVKCLGGVSVDGRDYDWYEYDFYQDNEGARTLYSYRSMIVEKATKVPFRTVSVARTNTHQWVETRRYDPALTIQAPPPEPPLVSKPAAPAWLPPYLGRGDADWPPRGPTAPPYIFRPPGDVTWPPRGLY
jgi:hypothetical protein